MITFKQYLAEKALTPTVFAKTVERLSADAKLGFELEMWVPAASSLLASDAQGAHTTMLWPLKYVHDWQDIFDIDKETLKKINDDFQEWRKTRRSPHEREFSSFGDYRQEKFPKAASFAAHYNLQPKYGWVNDKHDEVFIAVTHDDDAEADYDTTAAQVADELSDVLKRDVVATDTTSLTKWTIVQDSSIEGDELGVGIEIVSPPQKIKDALEDLKTCFKFMVDNKLETNSSTGLHINLSIPDLKGKLDPLKLILFMGEEHILKKYGRQLNTYAKKHYDDMIQNIKTWGVLPKSAPNVNDLIRFVASSLKQDKYRTVNLMKLSQGYLEFRSAGNKDYHKKANAVFDDIGRFLTVLELACDPDAERQQYLKKVAKLFQDVSSGHAKDLDLGLEEFVKKNSHEGVWDMFELATSQLRGARGAASSVYPVVLRIGTRVKKNDLDVPVKVIVEFKQMLNKIKKHTPDIIEQVKALAQSDAEADFVNAFLKAFNIK